MLILAGMFLWVHLVVEVLRSCYSDWDLEKSSKSLPKGLEAASVLNRSPTMSSELIFSQIWTDTRQDCAGTGRRSCYQHSRVDGMLTKTTESL